nr:type IX secretion system sortase PorU [Bacteroidota bacterium]
LDYLLLSVQRKLVMNKPQVFFRSRQNLSGEKITFKIDGVKANSIIWDISNPYLPSNQLYTIQNNLARFGTSSVDLQEYVVFDPTALDAPVFIEKVANQNLQGEGVFDMIIVTVDKFKQEALRLADFRASNDQLSIKVTTVKEIYNEFSSGAKDVTAIRDYMKYLYNLSEPENGIKYLLLFGKGSYDIKNKLAGNINYVPIYGSRNSLHPLYSYSSDDYYGFLDDDEGEWIEDAQGDHLMDIGIGRIPVRDIKQAKLVVDKIINYNASPAAFGAWRKDIYFVADDEDFNLHQLDADRLAKLVDTAHTEFNVNKIYLDSYHQYPAKNNLETSPDVNKALNDAIKSGAFIVNYTGHGGQYKWAEEGILDTAMINKWKNPDKLPFFVTATCTFGKHDDHITKSGGEKMLMDTKGGSIGLITSGRNVFSSTNYVLNNAFYNCVFKQIEGEYLSIGQIFKEVKNTSLRGSINRNFSLLGDPSMKLAYPKKKVVLTSIINIAGNDASDTLKALGKVKIKGKVLEDDGSVMESFQGILQASIFDKLYATTTLGHPFMTYQERNSLIFKGKASVVDGKFEFDFIVPKNISYNFNEGKISLYASDPEKGIDASGSNQKIKIGGSDPNAVAENKPPQIKLYLNDTTFRNGGTTASNSLLMARISDDSGINITNNYNHHITATLNGDKVYILNNFYETEINNYKVGWVNYPIDDLPRGRNILKVQAWDIHNNVNESILEFYVEDDARLSLNNVINYPNPFSERTIFQFEHNAAGENILINLDIFSIKGEHVYGIENLYPVAPATLNTMEWDGRNKWGNKLNEGIYIYKITIKSEATGLKNQQYKRLIIKI